MPVVWLPDHIALRKRGRGSHPLPEGHWEVLPRKACLDRGHTLETVMGLLNSDYVLGHFIGKLLNVTEN